MVILCIIYHHFFVDKKKDEEYTEKMSEYSLYFLKLIITGVDKMSSEMDKEAFEKYLFDETLPEEEITKRQWQIIDAAVKIFSEKGFDGSRTSDIAKEADVAEGTIFRYYKTKKELLVGLLIPLVIKFFRPLIFMPVEKIIKNKDNKPIEDIMAEVFYDRLKLAKKNMPLIKTVMIESSYHQELLEPIQKSIAPKLIPLIDDYIKNYIEDGTLRDLEPRLVTRTLMSLLIGYEVLTNILPDIFKGNDEKEEMKKISNIILNGIKKESHLN